MLNSKKLRSFLNLTVAILLTLTVSSTSAFAAPVQFSPETADGGLTWTEPGDFSESGMDENDGAAFAITDENGDLVLTDTDEDGGIAQEFPDEEDGADLADTEALATRANAAPYLRKAIYVLPGFMESEIYDADLNTVIWPGASMFVEMAANALGIRAQMVNNPDGTGMRAYVDRSRDKSGAFWSFLPMITSIKLGLSCNNMSNVPVEFFSYNWVADLNDTARELAADINAKGYDKVIFVAHSNGGLLASAYIAQSPENKSKVEKAIFVSVPILGTHIALEPIETGAPTINDGSLAMGLLSIGYDLFLKPISKGWVQAWAKNSPNVHQLMAGDEYLELEPVIYKSGSQTQYISTAEGYYELLKKSPNVNKALLSDSNRSLKYLRQEVFQGDVLGLWEGVDLTMLGCESGYITPTSAIYRQSGSKAIYEGSLYSKRGDGFVADISMNGLGRFPFVNIPCANHLGILIHPTALYVINNIISGASYASYASMPNPPADAGMSDMLRVELKSSDSLTLPTGLKLKVYDRSGQVVAQSDGGTQKGFSDNGFAFSSWSTSEYQTNILCYIPKSGYKLEVTTGQLLRTSSSVKASFETLDASGALSSIVSYTIRGAGLLSGEVFTLNAINAATTTPTVPFAAKLTKNSSQTFRAMWNFVESEAEINSGQRFVPAIEGADASYVDMRTYNWTSSDTSVATVNASGTVVGVSPGTTVVTAAAKNDSYKVESFVVTVE